MCAVRTLLCSASRGKLNTSRTLALKIAWSSGGAIQKVIGWIGHELLVAAGVVPKLDHIFVRRPQPSAVQDSYRTGSIGPATCKLVGSLVRVSGSNPGGTSSASIESILGHTNMASIARMPSTDFAVASVCPVITGGSANADAARSKAEKLRVLNSVLRPWLWLIVECRLGYCNQNPEAGLVCHPVVIPLDWYWASPKEHGLESRSSRAD